MEGGAPCICLHSPLVENNIVPQRLSMTTLHFPSTTAHSLPRATPPIRQWFPTHLACTLPALPPTPAHPGHSPHHLYPFTPPSHGWVGWQAAAAYARLSTIFLYRGHILSRCAFSTQAGRSCDAHLLHTHHALGGNVTTSACVSSVLLHYCTAYLNNVRCGGIVLLARAVTPYLPPCNYLTRPLPRTDGRPRQHLPIKPRIGQIIRGFSTTRLKLCSYHMARISMAWLAPSYGVTAHAPSWWMGSFFNKLGVASTRARHISHLASCARTHARRAHTALHPALLLRPRCFQCGVVLS